MHASILALSTVVPPYVFLQEEVAEKIIDIFSIDPVKQGDIRRLYKNSAINTRHSILPDFLRERSEWGFWGKSYPETIPGTSQRNDIYKKEAPNLAKRAAKKVIDEWGGDPNQITHVISVSCTGVMAPGIEFELMQFLNLNRLVNRLGINFMGCFGAFKGLSVAQSFAKENPKHRILLVCTELCSLHFQAEQSPDNILANSLFSDGAAAAIIGMSPQSFEKSMWEIHKQCSMGLDKTLDKMTWEAGDQGLFMKLSPKVPVLIGRFIHSFLTPFLESDTNPANYDWAIHPGGKSILEALEKELKLNKDQTQASWNILAQYGNMSSATFLFVLQNLYELRSTRKRTIGLGFGPGLSLEGILLY